VGFLGLRQIANIVQGYDGPSAATASPVSTLDERLQIVPKNKLTASILDSIRQHPTPLPYLAAESERVAAWRERLPHGSFGIRIAWQGNPANKRGQGRSVPLAFFKPLAKLPGVVLVNLQKMEGGVEQLGHAGGNES
jgi:hypothetical protein